MVFQTIQDMVGGYPVAMYECPCGEINRGGADDYRQALDRFYPSLPLQEILKVTDGIANRVEGWHVKYAGVLQYKNVALGPGTERFMSVLVGRETFSKHG